MSNVVSSERAALVSSERAAWSAANSEEKSVRAGVFMLLCSRSIEQRAQGAGRGREGYFEATSKFNISMGFIRFLTRLG